jgi:uncharacterized membrane protein YfcA
MPGLESLPLWALAWVVAVIALAGLTHGVIGIGFPLVATPLLTLAFDIKVAVFFILLPTVAVTGISAILGGKWRESLGRYWYLPVLMGLGSHLGTRIFIASDPAPFVLMLALLMLVYLNMERLGKIDIALVRRNPHVFATLFGLAAGFTEAMCNIAAPLLLIFFMLANVPAAAMIQIMNLCFVFGKVAQSLTWAAVGDASAADWLGSLPLVAVAAIAVLCGSRIRTRADAQTYRGWLRKFLWVMVVLLFAQFAQLMLSRA